MLARKSPTFQFFPDATHELLKQKLERVATVLHFEELHEEREDYENTAHPNVDSSTLFARARKPGHRDGERNSGEGEDAIGDGDNLRLEAKLLREALADIRDLIFVGNDVRWLANMVPHITRVHHKDDGERDKSPQILVGQDLSEIRVHDANDRSRRQNSKNAQSEAEVVERTVHGDRVTAPG